MGSHLDIYYRDIGGFSSVSVQGQGIQGSRFQNGFETEINVTVPISRYCTHKPHHFVAPELKRTK